MGKIMSKSIYCPKCGRKVMTYDERHHMNVSVKCTNCNKKVTYYPADDMVEINDLPPRASSSGVRFL